MKTLAALYEHNLWANLQLLDVCEKLDPKLLTAKVEGTYGEIGDTLTHLFSAERRYVERFSEGQRTPMPEDGGFPGFVALRESAIATGQALVELAEQDAEAEPFRSDFDGKQWVIERAVVLAQAINHATEHRAHVVTTLSVHGGPAVDIDAWAWGEATGAMKQRA